MPIIAALESVEARLQHLGASAATLTLLLVCCGSSGHAEPDPPQQPNLLLVTIDTLRQDHLSSFGYERETSPFLDSLAARGTRFTNCRATSSWTAPSMASLFTALEPNRHGVRNGWGSRDSQRIKGQQMLASEFETLAERLRGAGYTTFGISSNLHVSPETGLAQGFDQFVSLGFQDAPAVHRAALGLADRIRSSSPWGATWWC